MLKTAITATALGLAALSTPAIAGGEKAPAVTVEIADLNLSTPEGQERLDRRIETAARKVCGLDAVRTGTRMRSARSERCYTEAMKSVEQQVAAMIEAKQRGG
ncbi:MAG: UrcA family protein [Pseudomonadota bacterium]